MNKLPKVVICDLGIYLRINDIIKLKMCCIKMNNIENFTTNEVECNNENYNYQDKIFKLFKRFNSLFITNLNIETLVHINTFRIEKLKIIIFNQNHMNYITNIDYIINEFPYLNELVIGSNTNQSLNLNSNLTKLTIWDYKLPIILPLDNNLQFLQISESILPINLNKFNIRHLSINVLF